MDNRFFVSSSPHIRDADSVQKIMFSVIIALVPAFVGSVWFFGFKAAWLTILAVGTAIVTEAGIQKLRKVPVTISDGSAVITGILLAFNIPASAPFWLPIVGTFFAVAVGKMVFGGLGFNPMNPALLGRAFLLASWPATMTSSWTAPAGGTSSGLEGFTGATPLKVLKEAREIVLNPDLFPEKYDSAVETLSRISSTYGDLFWGQVGGCIGETSVILLLIGAAFLIYKRIIDLSIPLGYMGTVFVISWIFGGSKGLFTGDPIFHILSGGLILGAFFMATDMVTTPVTKRGRLIFGIGCGLLTMVIRLVGGYPEGVSYSILLMNLTTPLLDKYTKPKVFGKKE